VQRQYTGTAGRIENSQVGVFLTYTTKVGHTLIDRELYLPRCWSSDADRCAAAGVPEDTAFATKPALASTPVLIAGDGPGSLVYHRRTVQRPAGMSAGEHGGEQMGSKHARRTVLNCTQ
jgi:hypothetical protein